MKLLRKLLNKFYMWVRRPPDEEEDVIKGDIFGLDRRTIRLRSFIRNAQGKSVPNPKSPIEELHDRINEALEQAEKDIKNFNEKKVLIGTFDNTKIDLLTKLSNIYRDEDDDAERLIKQMEILNSYLKNLEFHKQLENLGEEK